MNPSSEEDILSLKHQLVNWLFTPIFLLLLFTMAVGYVAAIKLSNRPYDLALEERARLLASQFDPTNPSGHDIEAILYSLYDDKGQLLHSNANLPKPRPDDLAAATPIFRDAYYLGRRVRLLTYRHSPKGDGGAFIVQAAEDFDARVSLSRSILAYIVVPQFLFILIAGLAVGFGLKRGFEPVERLRRTLAKRGGDDLRPLDEELTPSEVRPLIRELNLHIERSKGLMEKHQRFVANAAHQLRTPFAGLKAQAELARRAPVPAETATLLDGICEGAGRCSHLVNQLLTLARNEPIASQENFRPLDLRLLAQEAARHWAPHALRKGIDLGFECIDAPLPLLADEQALRDLIDNLLDNAIRYTPSGGWVTLRLGHADGQPWLRVEDNGPGIPAVERERVFDRFYRIAGSGQRGSGLGLAIVQEAARRHAAKVELETGPGGLGSSFLVCFPLSAKGDPQ